MNFKEAVNALYAGKKVRLPKWGAKEYIVLKQEPYELGKKPKTKDTIVNQDGQVWSTQHSISVAFEATYEEYIEDTKPKKA